ncbi:alpha/beta fold hydrolase [Sporosarcina sp. Te-1]|uniref:alpha/beta fold hydrolase n=1 Tax=Sporosarcina sp. Te-1 TaxID=2818390 RepID=UPI001A9FD0A4|nr:alpha/beta hydrolase [Sporosarcina sp. Te-1]QTD41941.1 alpha/beta hydrolase [Sporosarcina sp. Te-1]
MKFTVTGNPELETIILLHGGGLSDWSLHRQVDYLAKNYYVVAPIIDGHGEDGETTFKSIEDSANQLIDFIDTHRNGRVFAICGLSLGAQIVMEVLSKRRGITQHAVIESGLAIPIETLTKFSMLTQKMTYRWIQQKWFAKMQAKTLNIADHLFDKYFEDSQKISKQSLLNITYSNGNFQLSKRVQETEANVLIIVGSKEIKLMKESAHLLKKTIPHSTLYIAEGMNHGELSLVHTEEYLALIEAFFQGRDILPVVKK